MPCIPHSLYGTNLSRTEQWRDFIYFQLVINYVVVLNHVGQSFISDHKIVTLEINLHKRERGIGSLIQVFSFTAFIILAVLRRSL